MNKVLVCLEPPPLAPGDGVQPRLRGLRNRSQIMLVRGIGARRL